MVLVMQLEIIHISDAILRILEGRVHRSVLWQLLPWVYARWILDVLFQQSDFLIAVSS